MTNEEQAEAAIEEHVTTNRLKTRCCVCQHPIEFGPSVAMYTGLNTGHLRCPKCDEFLHVELLEGNECWSERWDDYLARTRHGPSLIVQHIFDPSITEAIEEVAPSLPAEETLTDALHDSMKRMENQLKPDSLIVSKSALDRLTNVAMDGSIAPVPAEDFARALRWLEEDGHE